MMEANEVLMKRKSKFRRSSLDEHDTEHSSDSIVEPEPSTSSEDGLSKRKTLHSPEKAETNLNEICNVGDTHSSTSLSTTDLLHLEKRHDEVEIIEKFSKLNLLKTTMWCVISNPIVFMTVIGVAANFLLKQTLPALVEPILTTLANSFSALALFFLGFTMIDKIKNLKFSTIVIILVLVFSKSLIFPLVTREITLHLENYMLNQTVETNQTESLSSFSFLYGTFPAAPSIFFYIARYKYLKGDDIISSALVFGTLASAPLMMISGKMISLKYNDSSATNFEDIECKTAYGFSILTWFSCIWVLYIFVASGRALSKLHRFTLLLVVSQMFVALVHIVWSNMTTDDVIFGNIHAVLALLSGFMSKCWLFIIMVNLLAIVGKKSSVNLPKFKLLHFLTGIANKQWPSYMIGFILPLLVTCVCLLVGGMPKSQQKMMIALSKSQLIVSKYIFFY